MKRNNCKRYAPSIDDPDGLQSDTTVQRQWTAGAWRGVKDHFMVSVRVHSALLHRKPMLSSRTALA